MSSRAMAILIKRFSIIAAIYSSQRLQNKGEALLIKRLGAGPLLSPFIEDCRRQNYPRPLTHFIRSELTIK
jgi:hypothetical protein